MEVKLTFMNNLLRALFNQKHINEIVDEGKREKMQHSIDNIWADGRRMTELEKMRMRQQEVKKEEVTN